MKKSNPHLKLPIFKSNLERRINGGGKSAELPKNRNKKEFAKTYKEKASKLLNSITELKSNFNKIDPSLIYEIEINQNIHPETFETELLRMGIDLLSVAQNKKGFWIVFNESKNFDEFNKKLSTYGNSESYKFFNAIKSFQKITKEKKIGESLLNNPLADKPEFINIELWKTLDPEINKSFIEQLKEEFKGDILKFRVTDELLTNSFVLLRVKLNKEIFDKIIELNEIARVDRPSIMQFNHFEYVKPDVSNIKFNSPENDASGILIVDSGIISNHPMLQNCIGSSENFQSGEKELQDIAGHGTAVAGCAAYGDIKESLNNKTFTPENWIFSAKIMYAERDFSNNIVNASYNPEKLIEHQFSDAIKYFLDNNQYSIKVVNISIGNSNEVWNKNFNRQLPFASLIDELAYIYSDTVFIVSAGNQDPRVFYDNIEDIKDNYPNYLTTSDFKIINPATSALALTIGSIAPKTRKEKERFEAEKIKVAIANENQPSPFTRTGLGINGMIKPELVEYGGNLILFNEHNMIKEDIGGKIELLNNKVINKIIKYDYGTSYSAPKVSYLAGKISNKFPDKSANFIKNMLLVGANHPFIPEKEFYNENTLQKELTKHLSVSGYGLSNYDRAVNSYQNRTVLWEEGSIGLNEVKIYSFKLPSIFFNEKGRKKITIVLTFDPETRSSRGDSYLGNQMKFHLFHSIEPELLEKKYAVISDNETVPKDIEKSEMKNFFPGSDIRKVGCHQKAWIEYSKGPRIKNEKLSLVLLNFKKWSNDQKQNFCISITFEHEKEIELYNEIKANIQTKIKI